MSDAVTIAIIGVVSSLVTGTLVVAVGVWADGRRKRADAGVAAAASDQTELGRVRLEYLNRIEKLEARLENKDAEIRQINKELGDARVTIAQQAARIADLEADLAQLHREQTS